MSNAIGISLQEDGDALGEALGWPVGADVGAFVLFAFEVKVAGGKPNNRETNRR